MVLACSCGTVDYRSSRQLPRGDLNMLVQDAQREVRTVFVGGFWGQLVSSGLWSAALGTWRTPRAAIFSLVLSGGFIFPITQLLLRSTGRPASLPRDNSWGILPCRSRLRCRCACFYSYL